MSGWEPLMFWKEVSGLNHVWNLNSSPPQEEKVPLCGTKGRVPLDTCELKVVFYRWSRLLWMWVAMRAFTRMCVCRFAACVSGLKCRVCVWNCMCWHNSKALVQSDLACVCMREWTLAPQEQADWGGGGAWGEKRRYSQVMWSVVLTGELCSQKHEGSVLWPMSVSLFVRGEPHCWMQPNQSWKISIKLTSTSRTWKDRDSSVLPRLWELNGSGRLFPTHLSGCEPPLFLLSPSQNRERGKSTSPPFLSVSFPAALHLLKAGNKPNNYLMR